MQYKDKILLFFLLQNLYLDAGTNSYGQLGYINTPSAFTMSRKFSKFHLDRMFGQKIEFALLVLLIFDASVFMLTLQETIWSRLWPNHTS